MGEQHWSTLLAAVSIALCSFTTPESIDLYLCSFLVVAESTYGTKLHRDDKNAAIFEQSSVDSALTSPLRDFLLRRSLGSAPRY